MPNLRWTLTASLATALMSSACASTSPPPVAPPRLPIPAEALRPCVLSVMVGDTVGALDTAYMERGRDLVTCEARRREAIASWEAERALQDRWREETEPKRRSLWPF